MCNNIYHKMYPDTHVHYIDSTLVKGVESFKYEARMHGMLDITFPKLSIIYGLTDGTEEHTIGMCTSHVDGERLLEIRASTYLVMDSFDKEQLLFHELAHCSSMRRRHCDSVEANGQPTSMMYPYMIDSSYYKLKRDEYIEELFHADPRCK
jgi:hypothetical protein